MKNVDTLYSDLIKCLDYTTRFERTKILVEVDRIITTCHRDHRMELKLYSVRYQASTKTIYIYAKLNTEDISDDTDYLNDGEFPENYSAKIYLVKKLFNI